ncbi:hypothetical protein [Variovorax saccharolyticus]|uniref:hypothetical protein n=1 Tax=Variovorax saccharolyticus TaxID=3053516 RepID=UPI00257540F6|nr:hypothetical protein [Variovorax sp. J31P216]MDM0029173.1 hypothetical protein [Variovorax sp. J31P216]
MRHFSGDGIGIRLLMDDELERISGGEGEDTDEVATGGEDVAWLLQSFVAGGVSVVATILGNMATTAIQRENMVASMIDPTKVTTGTTWQNEGGVNHEVPSWTDTTNGYLFIDTDRNGKPDVVLRSDERGNVQRNDGTGWNMIYSPGT